ncbi:MAG: hypothetical protein AAF226_07670, partial [Verrucomicrobiota bacterium]
LSEFILKMVQSSERFDLAISEGGNFEITHGPKAENSPIYHYFIKPNTNGNTLTRYFLPTLSTGAEGYQDPANYEDFRPSLEKKSPLEKDGFFRLAFSSCYLLTGGDSVQLCLKLDIGSPAIGEGEQGLRQFDEQLLRRTLKRYALLQGAEQSYHEIGSATAQGFMGRAKLPDPKGDADPGVRYLKLLDPPHVKKYRTDEMLALLQDTETFPASIHWERVTSSGKPGGQVLIISSPEFRSVGELLKKAKVQNDSITIADRVQLCRALINFGKQCFRHGVICQDLSIDDIMFEQSDLAEVTKAIASLSDDEPSPLFVGDYGSYCFSRDFSRDLKISRGEFLAPEDVNRNLPYSDESFQVYMLGIHVVQILAMSPGLTLDVVSLLSSGISEQEYTEALEKELAECLEQGSAELDRYRELVTRMLAYQPQDRPEHAMLLI